MAKPVSNVGKKAPKKPRVVTKAAHSTVMARVNAKLTAARKVLRDQQAAERKLPKIIKVLDLSEGKEMELPRNLGIRTYRIKARWSGSDALLNNDGKVVITEKTVTRQIFGTTEVETKTIKEVAWIDEKLFRKLYSVDKDDDIRDTKYKLDVSKFPPYFDIK